MKTKFKIGDKVKVIICAAGKKTHENKIGKIVNIDLEDKDGFIYKVKFGISYRHFCWAREIEKVNKFGRPKKLIPSNSRELKPNKKHVWEMYDMSGNKIKSSHSLNYDSYLKRLVELGEKVEESGIDPSHNWSWLNHLLGYIEAAKELIKR